MNVLGGLWAAIQSTMRDVLPIVAIILFFQLGVLRRPFTKLARLTSGFIFVVLGLSLFLMGLELALFPLGEEMAEQLIEQQADRAAEPGMEAVEHASRWYDYYWTCLFAFTIGVSTTIAEPSLMAVAIKAEDVSGGTIRAWGLRIAVALGVGLGVTLGTFRIVVGLPLPYFILTGYGLVMFQMLFAPKSIVPLAFDSGAVTTSTVTVPLITALGLGLAARVPGRDPVIDGFGLIAFASLFPMLTVMGYAQLARLLELIRDRRGASADRVDLESEHQLDAANSQEN